MQNEVTLHVYNIPYLTAIANAVRLLGFHVGVEVDRQEYSFGRQGIFAIRPTSYSQNGEDFEQRNQNLQTSVPLGYTILDRTDIKQVVKELKSEWTPGSYNLLTRNCQGFAAAFCHKLGLRAKLILAQYCSFTEESYASWTANWEAYYLLPKCQPIILKSCCEEAGECSDEHIAPPALICDSDMMKGELDSEGRLHAIRWDAESIDSIDT